MRELLADLCATNVSVRLTYNNICKIQKLMRRNSRFTIYRIQKHLQGTKVSVRRNANVKVSLKLNIICIL